MGNETNNKTSQLSIKLERNLQIGCEEPSSSEKESDSEFSPSKKLFVCTFPGCNKRFGKNSRLLCHTRIHTGERPYKCSYEGCQKSYARQFHLKRHVAVFHTEQISIKDCDKFRCKVCSKGFSNVFSLKKHAKIHEEGRYTCDECGSMFKKQQHLKSHTYEHSGIMPYSCDYPGCDKRFLMPSKLKRHSQVHLENRFSCSYENCKAKFNFHSELRKHLCESHMKVCEVCGKEFKTLCRLKTHLKIHEQSRDPFFCPYSLCDRYYLDPRNLVNHIRDKHQDNFKGHSCNICSRVLVTKQKLIDHMRMHNPNYPPLKTNKEKKPRRPRKDKGSIKRNLAKLLSGYSDNPVKDMDIDKASLQDVSPKTGVIELDTESSSVYDTGIINGADNSSVCNDNNVDKIIDTDSAMGDSIHLIDDTKSHLKQSSPAKVRSSKRVLLLKKGLSKIHMKVSQPNVPLSRCIQ